MSTPSPDLEIALHRRDGSAYSLEMRFSDESSIEIISTSDDSDEEHILVAN